MLRPAAVLVFMSCLIGSAAAQHAMRVKPSPAPSHRMAVTSSDPTVGLLPSDRSAWKNWTMAGLQSVGGIPNRTTVCATVKPSGGDDTSNIQTAVKYCPSGEVVVLSAGTFTIGEGKFVTINKSVVVRGSGPCAGTAIGSAPYPNTAQSYCTLIQRTGGATIGVKNGSHASPHFVMGATNIYSDVRIGAQTNLAVDGAQGSYTIQVASTIGYSAGTIVVLDEASGMGWQPSWVWSGQQEWAAPDYRLSWRAQNPTCQSGDRACAGGSTDPKIPCYFHFSGTNTECDHYTSEIKQVASVGAGSLLRCPRVVHI